MARDPTVSYLLTAFQVRTLRAVTVAAALLVTSSIGRAQTAQPLPPPDPTPEQGLALANRLCTNCHQTDTQKTGSTAPVGSPTFATIANKPDQTFERVVGMMLQPHQPMPDIQLTREEILNLVAYLDSLRRKDLPPLREPKGDDLPKPTAPAKT